MIDARSRNSLVQLGKSLRRLGEALMVKNENSLVIDGTIKRFEIVADQFWLTLKRLLAVEGIQVTTPREALRAAFQAYWIDDKSSWLEMYYDCQESAHYYDEETAQKIHRHIKEYFPELKTAYTFLVQRFEADGK